MKDELVEVIRKWKFKWMDQPDYFERAFRVDSNMIHSLANELLTYLNQPKGVLDTFAVVRTEHHQMAEIITRAEHVVGCVPGESLLSGIQRFKMKNKRGSILPWPGGRTLFDGHTVKLTKEAQDEAVKRLSIPQVGKSCYLCVRGVLRIVAANEPYSPSHLACDQCDSTFNLPETK